MEKGIVSKNKEVFQIIEPETKEITMQEIADKFGVSVDQIKIKK